ncbi:MAG: type II toxin-antitoxin system RelE/ParE family toxin [Thermomicrobiales bacterium]
MSARRLAVRFSRDADRDMASIALHTRRTWGEEQQLSYEAAIFQVLDMLSQHPQAGRPRDDLFPGCRSIQAEHHVIYYYQSQTDIVAVRILHSRQDASAAVIDPGS